MSYKVAAQWGPYQPLDPCMQRILHEREQDLIEESSAAGRRAKRARHRSRASNIKSATEVEDDNRDRSQVFRDPPTHTFGSSKIRQCVDTRGLEWWCPEQFRSV